MVAELLTATAVWGAIGYGLDRLLGIYPVLLLVGLVVGHATGIYIVWRRTREMTARAQHARGGEAR